MINEIIKDDVFRASELLKKYNKKGCPSLGDTCIVCNHDPFGEFLYAAYEKANQNVVIYDFGKDQLIGKFFEGDNHKIYRETSDAEASVKEGTSILFCADCCTPAKAESLLFQLDTFLKIAVKKHASLYLLARIPSPDGLPKEVTAIAEREYDYLLQQKQKSTEELLYLQLENLCRASIREHNTNVNILRFTNVFGPEMDVFEGFSFKEFIAESQKSETVTITDSDASIIFSATHIVDAFGAILSAVSSKKTGHVFNVAAHSISIKTLKNLFYESFEQGFSLHAQIKPSAATRYRTFSSVKLSHYGWKITTDLKDNIYRLGLYYTNTLYNTLNRLPTYSGRLERIKKLELDILKFVDQICREHNIQYFLAGGSLLGAVRNHNIIPWDDDLDIGMLREDYEKFRKVCPQYMIEEYTYDGPRTDPSNHYHFDKIRLKNTYFSTRYSSNFKINDGIFFDIVAYDQTSNHNFFTKIQLKLLIIWIRFLNLKWQNKPKSKSHPILSKILLCFLRLLPFSFLHWGYERIIRFYEKKKNAKYVIDGMGLNIRKGRFLRSAISEVEYVDFGDMKAPIPKGYDQYLRHLYGDHYMEILPISQRTSGHHMARIDLGGYLYTDQPNQSFPNVNLSGELYEQDR